MVQYASPEDTDRVLAWDPQQLLYVRGADVYLSVDTRPSHTIECPPIPRPPVGA